MMRWPRCRCQIRNSVYQLLHSAVIRSAWSISHSGLVAVIRCGLHERLLWVKAPRQEREPAYRPIVRGAALRVVYRQKDWDLNRRYPYPPFYPDLSENGRGGGFPA
jgi:hypothetical protein